MGLAARAADGSWRIRSDTEQVLRAMQRAGDRQKTLFAHGELVSDKRLPCQAVDWQQTASVEGRVLVHGEEEHSGKNYLLLESTAAKVYYMPYTREMEEARSLGGLKTNSFVRLRKLSADGRLRIEIEDLGDAEAVLSNRSLLLLEEAEACGNRAFNRPRRAGEDGLRDTRGHFAKSSRIARSSAGISRSKGGHAEDVRRLSDRTASCSRRSAVRL